jgi:hypothetical protein
VCGSGGNVVVVNLFYRSIVVVVAMQLIRRRSKHFLRGEKGKAAEIRLYLLLFQE